MPGAEAARRLTLGTAGHIDHGKTALIAALTGTDTDRLPDERRRGISIELGYARLDLPGGGWLSVVDVPGHERLVRTMVAGATGVDLFLLAIAADDGVMPQTREHVAVLRALGVERGIVALTKRDLVDAEAMEVVAAEVEDLLPETPKVAVSARTGEGVEELRAAIAAAATAAAAARASSGAAGPALLHVDRKFSLRGIGTVVTGTLWSGSIAVGERVEILPRGLSGRARGIEVHGEAVERAAAGQRVALNLGGIERTEVERGDVVASPGSGLRPSYRLDVELRLASGARPVAGRRVQVHHGTRDAPARVVDLDGGVLAQVRLEAPMLARPGDRFVLREIAPANTIGGGVVLDPGPARHGSGQATERLRAVREWGLATVLADEETARAAGGERAEPDPALPAARLDRAARLVLAVLDADGAEPRAPVAIAEALRLEPARVERILATLVASRRAVRLAPQVYYSAPQLDAVRERTLALARERGEISLPGLRDRLGTSRKYAQAILDHLDGTGVTVRHGDRHVLRRPGAS